MSSKTKKTIHAVNLGIVKYGGTSLIANCYTLEFGLQSYMLKGILSRGRKKNCRSLFEPLNLLELEASQNKENKIGYMDEAKIAYVFTSIPYNLTKKALVLFLAEVIHQVAREEQGPNKLLFDYIKKKLIWLDSNHSLSLFHLKIMLDITKYIGFYPNISNSNKPYFDLETGCFTSIKPGKNFIENPLKEYFIQLLGIDFDMIDKIKILKRDKFKLLNQVITYFELHLQQFKPPKSLEILNEIFTVP